MIILLGIDKMKKAYVYLSLNFYFWKLDKQWFKCFVFWTMDA